MSRYFPDRKDSTGAKRGAGPYSRSYLKLNEPPEYSPFAKAGNDDHHHPRDLYKQVTALSTRNFGLSAEVSRGNRPAHSAKTKPEGYGIDPSSREFKKHKDYR
jgi:hypothetical protein